MVCIYCASPLAVTNSRAQTRTNSIWRRRHCAKCGSTITTSEVVDYDKCLLFKRSEHALEPFSKTKLLLSIYESTKHRASALGDAEALTDTIMSQLLAHIKGAALTRQHVVSTATSVLEQFDAAAVVHYTVYHPLK